MRSEREPSGTLTDLIPFAASPVAKGILRRKLRHMLSTERPSYYDRLRQFETELISEALRQARGNQAQAARMLGLAPTTLSSQLRRLGIQATTFKCATR